MPGLPDAPEHEAINDIYSTETAILNIDLDALAENYQLLNKLSGKTRCAAVVKADAYGLGVIPVVDRLIRENCKIFFVANLNEACQIRKASPDISIFNMGGLNPNTANIHCNNNITPVLNTTDEIIEWANHTKNIDPSKSGAAIQFNTGMNRLGLQYNTLQDLIKFNKLGDFKIELIMSHLACADEPDHPLNRSQLQEFSKIRKLLPDTPASLCNSAGILLGPDYHFDIVRPGISLYGGCATIQGPNRMKPVAYLNGRIAQVQHVQAGQSIGYGAIQTLKRDSRIATISIGYADGFFRYLGSTDYQQKSSVAIGEYLAPVVGRVSMDLITVDITDIPEELVHRSMFVEIIGRHILVEDLARQGSTIGYEILTSLGNRYKRIYREKTVEANG